MVFCTYIYICTIISSQKNAVHLRLAKSHVAGTSPAELVVGANPTTCNHTAIHLRKVTQIVSEARAVINCFIIFAVDLESRY